MKDVLKISIPNTHRDYFDYAFPQGSKPVIGARVWVPFRKQQRLGVIVGKGLPENLDTKLRDIAEFIDDRSLLSVDLMQLCQWVSQYYQAPLSEVIALALPKKYRLGEHFTPPTVLLYQLSVSVEEAKGLVPTRAKRQQDLIDFFAVHPTPMAYPAILAAGFKPLQLTALTRLNVLKVSEKPLIPSERINPHSPPVSLNEEQQTAVDAFHAQLHEHQCFLLHGVTGSGKTEVYMQVITRVLDSGKQVLVLVPEIGLTPQLLDRFSQRFSSEMAVVHSHLGDKERQAAWHKASHNEVKLVIGTRTAIFTPMPALGLIILDEEHDASFKQMDGVRYSARDTALMRAYLGKIPVILGSATPSLESLHNSVTGKYKLLSLTQKAMASSPLHYQVIDVRNQSLQHGLAKITLDTVQEHLQQNNQVLVFINRRGFAPVLLCHECGWMTDCRACDSHLTLHRKLNKMICHHCGLMQPIPVQCHSCKSRELIPIGAGTQRIHEFLSEVFPRYKVLRFDRDEVRTKSQLDEHLECIHNEEAQLIVGTQMLAKGHHFPRLTLVVVVDADNGFYNQDFRALERLGQLLTQVSGRAGRAQWPGKVLIQTHLPHHPSLNLLLQEGYLSFANSLLEMRRQAQLPPYHFLAVIRAQGRNIQHVLQFLHLVKNYLQAELIVLGPAPAPLARKANQHRLQLLIKSPTRKKLQTTLTQLRHWLTIHGKNKGATWSVDIDPMDLS